MRNLTAPVMLLLVAAALSGCTDNAETDSLPGVDTGATANVNAVLAVDMGLPAETSYYMDSATSGNADAAADAYVLVEGDGNYSAEVTATVLVNGQCASWVSENSVTDDLALPGTAEAALVAQAAGDPSATLTMSMEAVAEGGSSTVLGSQSIDIASATQANAEASADAVASADPSSLPALEFEIPLDGAVIAEGEYLMVSVCVDDNAGATIQFGGPEAPSGIPVFPQEILDTDGDGYGDSEERRTGSDPEREESTPANPSGNSAGPGGSDPEEPTPIDPDAGNDPDNVDTASDPNAAGGRLPPEPVIGAFVMTITLALAGFALLRRPTP